MKQFNKNQLSDVNNTNDFNPFKSLLMKTKITLIVLLLALVSGSAMAKCSADQNRQMPAAVKTIIDNKCLGCHNSKSKNDKAKEDLNFSTFNHLSKLQKISAYKRIGDTVKANEMPPQKFLKHYPEKTVSEAEKELIMQWAKQEAEALVKGL